MAKKRILTSQQQKFIDGYIKYRIATKAAEYAGYSKRSAGQQGYRLLKNDQILSEILRRMNIISTKSDVTVERIEKELARIAFSDVTNMFVVINGKLSLRPFNELTEGQRQAISEIKLDGKSVKFKAWNKNNALEILAKYKGMLKNELVNLNVDMNDLSNEQLQRLASGEPIEKVLQG